MSEFKFSVSAKKLTKVTKNVRAFQVKQELKFELLISFRKLN